MACVQKFSGIPADPAKKTAHSAVDPRLNSLKGLQASSVL
jgi:hypothetical protein